MGSLSQALGMLPGMGEVKAQLDQLDDREIDRVAAIIQSMTPAERADPKILNGVPPGPHRPRLGHRGAARQQPRRAVRRGAEDDAPDGQGRRHARDARACPACRAAAAGRRAAARPAGRRRSRRRRVAAATPPSGRCRSPGPRAGRRRWTTCSGGPTRAAAAAGPGAVDPAELGRPRAAGGDAQAARRRSAEPPAVVGSRLGGPSGTLSGSYRCGCGPSHPPRGAPYGTPSSHPTRACVPSAHTHRRTTPPWPSRSSSSAWARCATPQYRIVVADSRTKRRGRAIEEIGLYHPKEEPSRHRGRLRARAVLARRGRPAHRGRSSRC